MNRQHMNNRLRAGGTAPTVLMTKVYHPRHRILRHRITSTQLRPKLYDVPTRTSIYVLQPTSVPDRSQQEMLP